MLSKDSTIFITGFFEDFDSNFLSRTIEAFVQAGGNLDVLLTIHGPLELDDIRTVRFPISSIYFGYLLSSHCHLLLLGHFLIIIEICYHLQDKFEDPIVTELINVQRESESETLSFSTTFKPKSPGTYGICLDNRNSRFVSKNVQVG